eukprot:6197685-Amphidinium_carterae.2
MCIRDRSGRGRGPICNLRQMVDRLNLFPTPHGWRQGDQHFTWDEADCKVKWDSAMQLCKEVVETRLDLKGLDSGLSTQTLRQLKLDRQNQKDNVKTALNAGLGGVWPEARASCGETVEDLEHIVHHCPACSC